ncbi:MAG: LD-carboxypeptidase [Alphaproteobacteria bacterium]|nr:LD-carboxypeptidase [Alphaproteobacteria bacterium]
MNITNYTKKIFLSDEISCIGICAPASGVDEKDLYPAISFFEENGIKVKCSPNLYSKDRFLAGSDSERATQLMDLFVDDEVQAIFSARGGYGSLRILDKLDYSVIKKNKKPFFGFSDTTALQLALLSKARLPTVSGITLAYDVKSEGIDQDIVNSAKKCLVGGKYSLQGVSYGDGIVEGTLVGGCLSLITPLLGTDYLPDFRDSILLLEDVGEEPYKIDRMITQLYLADVFNIVKGVVIGRFKDCVAKDEADGTIKDVLYDMLDKIPEGKPVLMGVEYSHNLNRKVLPIGGDVVLDADNGMLFVEGVSLYS